LQFGGVQMNVELSGRYAYMAHGVRKYWEESLDVFARLTPVCDAAAGEVVPEVVQPGRRFAVQTAAATQSCKCAIALVAGQTSRPAARQQRR